jgi:hypothetical protein
VSDILDKIAQAPSLPLLWRQMARYYDACGFAGMSYHWIKPGTNMPAAVPFQYGFSEEEVEIYLSLDFQRLDIVPRASLAAGHAIRWSQIWRSTELTADEREFVVAMRSGWLFLPLLWAG